MNEFSDEDYQFGEANQLGIPLKVHHSKPPTRLIWWLNLSICVLSAISIVVAIILGIENRYQLQTGNDAVYWLSIINPAFVGLCALFFGTVIYPIEAQQTKIGRVIVYERGLLKVTRKIRTNRVEIVRWQAIVEVRRAYIGESFAYAISYKDGAAISQFTFHKNYQDFDDLVAVIEQRSGNV